MVKGFFAVDKKAFANACGVSMNTAIAYLVLARGTGGDNSTTSWSANAVEKYTQISRSKAKRSVESLICDGFVKKVRGGTFPQYKILATAKRGKLDGDAVIWLPNEIVTSAAGEIPPIERIRQTQEPMCLRLFIDLYYGQNLLEEGGIKRSITHKPYQRRRISESGKYTIWGFNVGTRVVYMNSEIASDHCNDELTPQEIENGENEAVDFFDRFSTLQDLGLIYWVPHLVESGHLDAEIIHPVGGEEGIEQQLEEYSFRSADKLLNETYDRKIEEFDIIAPAPRHFKNIQIIGIARLRYRPHTSLTSAWWAEINEKGKRFIEGYLGILGEENDDLQYQGRIKG